MNVITAAELSQDEQRHIRERRYLLMMGVRLVCIIGGAVAFTQGVFWLVPVLIVGMVVLPWVAVLTANDRLPRRQTLFHRYQPHPGRRAIEAARRHDRPLDG